MNFKYFFSAFFISAGLFLASCTDTTSSGADETAVTDSSCSGTDEESSSSIDTSSAPEVEKTDLSQFQNKERDNSVTDGEKTYKTTTKGVVTWMTENLAANNLANIQSSCHPSEKGSCSKYGRLYMGTGSLNGLCPNGFFVPGTILWKDLINSGIDFSPTFTGVCDKKDTMKCEGIDKSARYITSSNELITLSKDANGKISYTVDSLTENAFYSIRCVRFYSIAEHMDDLPTCDSSLNKGFTISVLDSNKSYTCSEDTWTSTTGAKCRNWENGEFYMTVTGILLLCVNNDWRYATMDDVDKPCSEENLYKEYSMNKQRYVCSPSGWKKLTGPDSTLGYCNKTILGNIGKPTPETTYRCELTGWKRINIADYYGKCDDEKKGEIYEFDNKKWRCSGTQWTEESPIDSALGFCTEENDGETATYDSTTYICLYNSWTKT